MKCVVTMFQLCIWWHCRKQALLKWQKASYKRTWKNCRYLLFYIKHSIFYHSLNYSAAKCVISNLFDTSKHFLICQGINLRTTEMQDTAKSFSSMANQVLRTAEQQQDKRSWLTNSIHFFTKMWIFFVYILYVRWFCFFFLSLYTYFCWWSFLFMLNTDERFPIVLVLDWHWVLYAVSGICRVRLVSSISFYMSIMNQIVIINSA